MNEEDEWDEWMDEWMDGMDEWMRVLTVSVKHEVLSLRWVSLMWSDQKSIDADAWAILMVR